VRSQPTVIFCCLVYSCIRYSTVAQLYAAR
jgi:hypothetical protein